MLNKMVVIRYLVHVNFLVAAILKDSDFREADRADCQFTTTATVLDNGSQVWL